MNIADYLFSAKATWFWIWISSLVLMAIIAVGFSVAESNPLGEVSCDRVLSYASEQCEVITKHGVIRQQANFWSNFAYAAFGLFIFFRRGTTIGKAVGLAFVFLALGSGLFHGTLTTLGQYLDIMGIDVLLLLLILHAVLCTWDRDPESTPSILSLIIFLSLVGLAMGLFKSIFDSTLVSVGAGLLLFVIAIIGIGRRRGSWGDEQARWVKWFGVLGLVVFLCAALFKFLDGKDVKAFAPDRDCKQFDSRPVDAAPAASCTGKCPTEPCCDKSCACCQDIYNVVDPPRHCFEVKPKIACKIFGANPVIQGHGLWHVLSATGLFFVFEFFLVLFRKEETGW